MALEPAIAVLIGLLVLDQRPALAQFAGIVLVVAAGGAAQRDGHRTRTPASADGATALIQFCQHRATAGTATQTIALHKPADEAGRYAREHGKSAGVRLPSAHQRRRRPTR